MPFKSEAQRRYLWANEPEIARDWTDTYGSKIQAADGGIMRLGFDNGGEVVDEMGQAYETSRYGNKYDPEYVTQEEFNEMFGEETSGINTLKNKFTGGVDYMKKLPGMAIGALSGIPGLGFLINSMRSNPKDQFLGDPYSMQNYKGPNYGYGNALRHGNLTGQDQFGINTRSMFGDYQGHYGNFMNDYLAGNINKNKFNRNKFAFAQDVTGTGVDSSNITGTPLVTQASIHRGGEPPGTGSGGGGSPAQQAATRARDLGNMRGGVGRSQGGLASLWPR